MSNKYFKKLLIVFVALWAPILHAIPEIQYWQTDNGAKVYFVSAPELPIVDVQVVFDAGSARDGKNPGIALMTNGLLAEGVDSFNADEIAEKFSSLGAEFSNSSLKDMSLLELRSLSDKDKLQPAIDLLAKIIGKPVFKQEAFERVKRQIMVSLTHKKKSPGSIASRAFFSEMYQQHPYGHPSSGTIKDVNKLNVKLVKEFHQKYFVAKNAVIAIVGDLKTEQAKIIANKLTAYIKAGEHAVALPAVITPTKGKTTVISHPSSSQSVIKIGMPVMDRKDSDFYALYLGNHILGGSGLVSRLSNEVRENRGLTYSVSSQFQPMREDGPFSIGLKTRNEKVAESLFVVQETLHDFIENGPTEKELKEAKQNITGGFPLRIDSNAKISGYLMMIGFYDMSLKYLDNFNQRIAEVTLEQIKDAFQRRIFPELMQVVVVGNITEDDLIYSLEKNP